MRSVCVSVRSGAQTNGLAVFQYGLYSVSVWSVCVCVSVRSGCVLQYGLSVFQYGLSVFQYGLAVFQYGLSVFQYGLAVFH